MIIVKRELLNLGRSYQRMEEILRWDDRMFYMVKEKVSLWSPAQQLWHIGMVNSRMFQTIDMLFRDEAPEILRAGKPTFQGWLMLLTGRVGRGRMKAPPALVPPPEVDRVEAGRAVRQSKREFTNAAAKASQLHEVDGRFAHEAMGALNGEQWLRFSQVHTRFHLGMIDLIGKAAKTP